ncbi:MAG: hypothetical protein VX589_07785, partial [Myxococcota bacterium]|nr:hypothetical protein [Myxococcota bacterium]
CDRPGLLEDETARLARSYGHEIIGGRHHYWRLGQPIWSTLRRHERAGLQYDSSIAFNEVPGFRLGIGYPFFPWDPEQQRALTTLQIPVCVMDGALLYDPAATVEEAVGRFEDLLTLMKAHEVTAAIDWHVRASWSPPSQPSRYADAYASILTMLAEDSDVDVTTPTQLLASR